MKKHLLQVLLCTGLLLCLLTVPALAADWTYDPAAKTLSGDILYPCLLYTYLPCIEVRP